MKPLPRLPLLVTSGVLAFIFVPFASDTDADESDDEKVRLLVEQLSDAIESKDRKRMFAVCDSLKALRKRAVPPLIEALKDGKPITRLAALNAIEGLGLQASDAVPLLIEIAQHDPEDGVRIVAVSVLGAVGLERTDDVLPVMHAALGDDNPIARQEAIWSLHGLSPLAEKSAPWLVERIDDADETLNNRRTAIDALVAVAPNSETVLQKLIDLLDDEYLCGSALDALGELGPRAKPAVPKIIQLLKNDPFGGVNQDAAETLGKIGPSAEAAVPYLISAMNDHDSRVCENSARALGEIGPVTENVVPALIQAVQNEQSQCRGSAAVALGQIGPRAKDAVPVLIRAFEDKNNAYLRSSLAQALYGIGVGSDKVLAVLTSAVEAESENESYRVWATKALGKIAANHQGAVPVLARLLKHDDPRVRIQAASALGTLGQADKPTLDTLIGLLKHPDDNAGTREEAARALGTIGQRAQPALPDLLAAVDHEDTYFRLHVIEAIGRIGPGDEHVKRALTEALGAEDELVRRYAAEALTRLGHVDAGVLPELVWQLRYAPSFRTLESLGRCGAKAKSALPALKMALKTARTPVLRKAVIEAIEAINE